MNLRRVLFRSPVEVVGQGMCDKLDVGPDDETGQPKLAGCSISIVDGLYVKIVTTGESWTPLANVTSFRVLYPDRQAVKAKK